MASLDVFVTLRPKKATPFTLKKVEQATQKILKTLGWSHACLSVLLTNDREIQKINKRYLKHNWPTDVIAFGQTQKSMPSKKSHAKAFLGDLVISLDTTKRQATEYGNDFFYELCFYLCHGILHMMGYRDKTKKERLAMEQKQAKILRQIGINR